MPGSEKKFETKIKTWLKNHNCYYVKFFANAYTRRGVPDILASVNGWFVGIEVKADSGRPSELQLDNIQLIRDSGGYAWVVYPSGFEQLQTKLVKLLNNQIFNNLESEVILK